MVGGRRSNTSGGWGGCLVTFLSSRYFYIKHLISKRFKNNKIEDEKIVKIKYMS